MTTVIVTGVAGFLGSYLTERLLAAGHRVIGIDMSDGRKIEHLLDHPRLRFIQGSILDQDLLAREIPHGELLVHFAAIADPKRYVQEPLTTLDIDLRATLHLLSLAAARRMKVLFASTSEIYGRNPQVPWKEDADRVLGSTHINRWCYSTAKAAGEHYCFAYGQQEQMPFVIVRFFNVYGPRLDDLGSGRVIPIFLKQFLADQPVTIHGDGRQTRTYVYVEDAADAVVSLLFAKQAEGEAFNIGSVREVSVLELAQLLKQVGGFTSPIQFVPHHEVFGPKYEDIPRRVPDVSKIKRSIGWEATTSLEDGLLKTINYYREQAKGDARLVS